MERNLNIRITAQNQAEAAIKAAEAALDRLEKQSKETQAQLQKEADTHAFLKSALEAAAAAQARLASIKESGGTDPVRWGAGTRAISEQIVAMSQLDDVLIDITGNFRAAEVAVDVLGDTSRNTRQSMMALAEAAVAARKADEQKTQAVRAAAAGQELYDRVMLNSASRIGATTARSTEYLAILANLTGGQYAVSTSGEILHVTEQRVATAAEMASAALAHQRRELLGVDLAMKQATAGMNAADRAFLNQRLSLSGLANQSGSAQFAVLSLGQTIQDSAQFSMGMAQGIRAISNNVQMFVQSLLMMSSTLPPGVSMMKALGTAMMGPFGVLAAFSAVTVAIEWFSVAAQRAKKEAEDIKSAFGQVADVVGTLGARLPITNAALVASFDISQRHLASLKEELTQVQLLQANPFTDTRADVERRKAQIAAIEEQITKEEKYIALIGEGAEAAKRAAEAQKALTEAHTDGWFTNQLVIGTIEDVKARLVEVRRQMEVNANEEVRYQRLLLEHAEAAMKAGLAQAIFDHNLRIVRFRLAEVGSNLQITADEFANLWLKLGEIDAIFAELTKPSGSARRTLNLFERLAESARDMRKELDLINKDRDKYFALVQENQELERQLQLLRVLAERMNDPIFRMTPLGMARGVGGAGATPADAAREALRKQMQDSAKLTKEQTKEWLQTNLSAHRTLEMSVGESASNITSLLDGINQDFFGRTRGWINNNQDAIEAWGSMLSTTIGSLGGSFMTLAKQGEETNMRLFNAGKVFGIAEAVINTAVGVTMALRQGGVFGIAAGALVAAAGAAQIAVIAGTQPGKGRGGRGGAVGFGGGSNVLLGTSGNLNGIMSSQAGSVRTSNRAISAPSVATSGMGGGLQLYGTITGNGRELVAVIREEVAAQKRMGVRDPLGI